ncbi:MAG TPA: NAD(P)H-binding protein [Candidatus Dormibacteraeota bacterium]|nr:NAD(P)H-binding protein [Candidatus Dormibacteraeota bacterium]
MNANELILVTGGTGALGRRVVQRLRDAGHRVRVASRHAHAPDSGVEYAVCDLERDEGVDAAVAEATIVIHCAGVGKIKQDTSQAQHITRAAGRAGVRHLVTISVVGADRIPVKTAVDRSGFAYFASQRAKELVVAGSGTPWTNLRATQFYDGFILVMVRGLSRLPIVPLPTDTRFQPVDADEVAVRLVELALGEPAGQAPDIAGPKIYDAGDLMRSYLDAVGKRRRILRIRMPGAAAAAIRAGANLAPDRAVGRRTWEEFLAAEIVPAVSSRP